MVPTAPSGDQLDLRPATASNTPMLIAIGLILLAYVIGSIASAVVVARCWGLPDPRSQGSGNPGTTNILRYGGRLAAAVTLLGDALKGALPVWLGLALGVTTPALALIGMAAFLGHLYPVFFGFKGGKGIATGIGVVLGWSWLAFVALAATWLVVAGVTRYSSLAALTGFVLAPTYLHFLTGSQDLMFAMAVMTAFTLWCHHENIQRLLAGTEKKIGR